MRVKHIPQRTCIGCHTVKPKRELVRLVLTPDGRVDIDLTGKRAGRGAYLHRERECWIEAFERRAIERALKMDSATSAMDRQQLEAFAAGLPSRGDLAGVDNSTRQAQA